MELGDRSSLRVEFPAGAQYGNALYRLRKAIKSVIAVEIHKQPEGALIVCNSEEQRAAVILVLHTQLPEYSVAEIQQ